MPVRYLVLCLTLLAFLGEPAEAQKTGRREKNVITAEEIAHASASNVYDLVRQLRPSWLTMRSGGGGIGVYIDGGERRGLDDLQSLAVERVQEVRLLSIGDATFRHGTGNVQGAIEVTTKR